MSTLPPFTEPEWSTLPKEAVAWAVDEDGEAWAHTGVPRIDEGDNFWFCNLHDHLVGYFNPSTFDWRTTLRLRPTVAESARVEVKPDLHVLADHLPEIKALTESVEGLTAEQRNYELERLAELAWVARITSGSWDPEGAACGAFNMAIAFISERKERRNK